MKLSPELIIVTIAAYFLVLIGVSYFTSRRADSKDFFLAGRQAPWLLVAIGMIGASMSGITFISVPGKVGVEGLNQNFSYLQVVLGYLLGYLFIATVLMPMYYRLNLTSIYSYLGQRFGFYSNKMGAAFFLFSRIIGASLRLFLIAVVLDQFVLGVEPFNIPFEITVIVTIGLIWVYTFSGGIKTIVWTDALQTIMFLTAAGATIYFIGQELNRDIGSLVSEVWQSELSKTFFFSDGWGDPNNFWKQFFSGALITIVMTGLDQDMMQKNISCPNIRDAQKNMGTFTIVLFFANLVFLFLGALLYLYAAEKGIDTSGRADFLYPTIALEHLPPAIGLIFMLGLMAAAYSSADSALTSLTTSFCVDFLNFEKSEKSESEKKKTRLGVHIAFSLLLALIIIVFNKLENGEAIIVQLFIFAGYTYGPLLGMFAYGMLTKNKINDTLVIPVCILAPVLTYLIVWASSRFIGFEFGFLNLALNGLVTMFGLWIISERNSERLI